MITFVGGSKLAKWGPNPLANMDSWGGGSKSTRTPAQASYPSLRNVFNFHRSYGVIFFSFFFCIKYISLPLSLLASFATRFALFVF